MKLVALGKGLWTFFAGLVAALLELWLALPHRAKVAIVVAALYLVWRASFGAAFVMIVQSGADFYATVTLIVLAPILPGALYLAWMRGVHRWTPGPRGRFITVAVFLRVALLVLLAEGIYAARVLDARMVQFYEGVLASLTVESALLFVLAWALLAVMIGLFTVGLMFGIFPKRVYRLVIRRFLPFSRG